MGQDHTETHCFQLPGLEFRRPAPGEAENLSNRVGITNLEFLLLFEPKKQSYV